MKILYFKLITQTKAMTSAVKMDRTSHAGSTFSGTGRPPFNPNSPYIRK